MKFLYILYVALTEIKPFLHKILALKKKVKKAKAKNPSNPNQVKNKQNPKSKNPHLSDTQGNAHLLHSFKTPSSKARVLSSNCMERGSRWGTLSSVGEVMLEIDVRKLRAKPFCCGRVGAQRQEGRSGPVL